MKLALPSFPRPGKTTLVLGFALVIGVIAALAANRFLSARIDAIEARSRTAMVEVVVARTDLPKGQEIGPGNVALRPIPRDYAHSNALTNDSFGSAVGRKLAYNIKGGEMLLSSMLEASKPATFSARVGMGWRAMTVAVDEINSISGLLEPGDVIDLIASLDRKGNKLTMPLLQGVQVIATGQRLVDDPVTGERKQYATVTLNVTPSQATTLIAARDGGKITALLRNPGDRQAAPGDVLDMNALLGQGLNQDPEIPVLYGGRVSKFPPEALWLGGYKAASGGTTAVGSNVAAAKTQPAATVPVLTPSAAGAAPLPSTNAADAADVPGASAPTVPGASRAADLRQLQ
ncbi:Flp pilus assembly protein CpaB [Noviherbaspirillum soli]|uniref:Flp pilus assembly protein CpaB n=1 Tax=Noviherbaspirillum soli TaxID=1064518 RepID=UPI00188ACFBD|nr:Flp pilus assembly protein CpaB [Noviherbaspirillum soli]